MIVYDVTFNEIGRRYQYTYGNDNIIKLGELVICETFNGLELGKIKKIYSTDFIFSPNELRLIPPIKRIASNDDISIHEQNHVEAINSLIEIKRIIKKLNIIMKPTSAWFSLDRKKYMLFYTAEERIDFRDLVKQISTIYKGRIELRHESSREAVKKIGAIGPCGYIVCCQTYLGQLESANIKMLKNQNISFSQVKNNGVCQKLLCCLKYEDDIYTELRKNTPKIGDEFIDSDGRSGTIVNVYLIKQQAKVKFSSDDVKYVDLKTKAFIE